MSEEIKQVRDRATLLAGDAPMTAPAQPRAHCGHECVCSKYIDHTNTGATPDRECNGETWCFKPCPHDTRRQPQPDALAERLEELVKHPDGFICMTDTPAVFTQRIEKIISAIQQEREQR